jgi:ATP/maltotriose-dependent transcriptional regulator MalT
MMLALAESQSNVPMQVSALNKLAAIEALRLGQFPEAEAHLVRASHLAHEQNVKPGLVEMAIVRCQMCTAKADFESLLTHMGEVIEIGEAMEAKEYMAMGLEHVAGSLMFLTRFDEAWETGQRGLKIAREVGDREHEAWLQIQTLAVCRVARGELDEAVRTVEAGLEIANRIGSLVPQIYGNWLLCEIARWRGEYEPSLTYGQRSVDASLPVEAFMPFMTVQSLGALGSTYLEISGHFTDEVGRFHGHAMKLLETPAGVSGGGTAWADLGLCALLAGDLETAESMFEKGLNQPTMFMLVERPRHLLGLALVRLKRGQADEALKLAKEAGDYVRQRGMRHVEPLVALTTGRIHAARGELEAALGEFSSAETLARGMRMRPVAWQAQLAASQALAAAGREAEAAVKRQAAQAIIDEIAGMFQDEELRRRYLAGVKLTMARLLE